MPKAKFRYFCDARQVDKCEVLEVFADGSELFSTSRMFEAMTAADGWDSRSLQASGFVAFEIARCLFGFINTCNLVLQGSDCGIFKGFLQIETAETMLLVIKNDSVFKSLSSKWRKWRS